MTQTLSAAMLCIARPVEQLEESSEADDSSALAIAGPLPQRKMGKDLEVQISKLINTAYFICKEEMPFSTYPTLIDLQEMDLGNFYRSDKACKRFLDPIFNELYTKFTSELKSKNCFSIMIDGATDTSVTEQEFVYVRFVNNNGIPENHYLSIEDIKHAHADGLVNCIERAFEHADMNETWKSKLIGFGSDGASVHLGVRGGVATKLKSDNMEHLVVIHFVAHRLELAATNAIKNLKVMRDVQDLLGFVYKQYHYSPKALRELRAVAESLEEKVLKPGNLHGTRWLPHVEGALQIVAKDFSIILTHFEHIIEMKTAIAEVQGRAKKVSKFLKDYSFLYMMFFIMDVLQVLKSLSLKMQTDHLTVAQLMDAIMHSHLSLTEMKTTNKDNLEGFLRDVTDGKYKSFTLINTPTEGTSACHKLKDQKGEIISKITETLNQRFENLEKNAILKAAVKFWHLRSIQGN